MIRVNTGHATYCPIKDGTPMRLLPRFKIFLLMALLLPLLVAGCASMKPGGSQPPDYIKLTSMAKSPAHDLLTSDTLTGMLNVPLKTDAVVPLRPEIASAPERVLIARAEARRNALRKLGQTVGSVADPKGRPLAQLLKSDEPRRKALGRLLDSRSHVTFEERDGQALATVAIAPEVIVSELNSPQYGALAYERDDLTSQELLTRRNESLKLATEDAKLKLRAQVLSVKLADARLLSEALLQNHKAEQRLNELIARVAPDEVKYHDDGAAVVTIFFDANDARALVEPRRRGWLVWWSGS